MSVKISYEDLNGDTVTVEEQPGEGMSAAEYAQAFADAHGLVGTNAAFTRRDTTGSVPAEPAEQRDVDGSTAMSDLDGEWLTVSVETAEPEGDENAERDAIANSDGAVEMSHQYDPTQPASSPGEPPE